MIVVSPSARLEAFRLEHSCGGRSGEEPDWGSGRVLFSGPGPHPRREDRYTTVLPWQRTHQLCARHGHDFRSLRDAELGIAFATTSAAWAPGTKIVFGFI